MNGLLALIIALLPVLGLLLGLILLDSYKLVPLRSAMAMIVAGAIVALLCYLILRAWLEAGSLTAIELSRYVAPWIEEIAKGVLVVWLIRTARIGFLVDATIYGFAIGAGFAVVENLSYFLLLETTEVGFWIVRGFGTAVLHGGTVALVAVTARFLADRTSSALRWRIYVPGLLLAVFIHSLYNQFLVSPRISTVIVLLALPALVFVVFRISEAATRDWLGIGFDTDCELLELINEGRITGSHVGGYLETLRDRFPGTAIADMICLIRLHLELSIQAKGLLIARQSGFEVEPSADFGAQLDELRFLERSIGRTGMLALRPIFNVDSRELWQVQLLLNRP